jgi:hypothetical protein
MSDAPYKWLDIDDAARDGKPVILYFSVGTCRVPYVAKYNKGFLDPRSGVMDWETVHPIPGDAPTGYLPIVWKD